MKYIMTKDRKIFDLSKISIPYQIVDGWIDFNSQGRFEIVREEDVIDELFDELVCDESLIVKFCNTEEIIKRILSEGRTIYGAIWIEGKHKEPILKSVAKLNEKREWELL